MLKLSTSRLTNWLKPTRKIVCLAASNKHGGLCYAGKDMKTGEWIRPVSGDKGEEITFQLKYENGQRPEVLDIVEIPLIKKRPNKYQPENFLVDEGRDCRKLGKYELKDLEKLCDDPERIFENEGYETGKVRSETMLESAMNSSLLFVKVEELTLKRFLWNGKRRVKAVFPYKGTTYDIFVTDPEIPKNGKDRERLLSGNIFLCVSTGLPYTDGYCYKWVASIIHF